MGIFDKLFGNGVDPDEIKEDQGKILEQIDEEKEVIINENTLTVCQACD